MRLSRLAPTALVAAVALAGCTDDLVSPGAALPPASRSLSEGAAEPATHMVVFADRAIPAGFAAQVAALGGTVERTLDPVGVAFVSGLDEAGKAALGGDAAVTYLEPETVLPLAKPVLSAQVDGAAPLPDAAPDEAAPLSPTQPGRATYHYLQWHLRQIGAPAAWNAGRLGSGNVRVGIIDTGLDYTHRDLAGRVDLALSRSFLPSEDAIVARYLPAGVHKVFDLQGHGTHVGSTVSSNGIIAAGVTSQVKLVGLKVCRSEIPGLSAGGCPTSATLSAIMYAADNGIDVVNLSLGSLFTKRTAGGYEEVIHRVFEYAKERKLIMVVSAGNDNVDLAHSLVPTDVLGADGTPTGETTLTRYPSLYGMYCSSVHTICVSATGPASARNAQAGPWYDIDAKAGYSNYGRGAIDLAAPGGSGSGYVWAACPTMKVVRTAAGTHVGSTDSYCRSYPTGKAGTSMAAPHVAALAALLVEQHGRNPQRVVNALAKSADDLGESGTDPTYGRGRINVARAMGL